MFKVFTGHSTACIKCQYEGPIPKQNKNPCPGAVYILAKQSPIWASSVSPCGSFAPSLSLNSWRSLSCLPRFLHSLGPRGVCFQLPKSLEGLGLCVSGSCVRSELLPYVHVHGLTPHFPTTAACIFLGSGPQESVPTERDF